MSRTHALRTTAARTFAAVGTTLLLAAAAGVAACHDGTDAPTGPSVAPPVAMTIAGTYVLEEVNGLPVPYSRDGSVWDSMLLTLGADGSAAVSLAWRETDDSGEVVDQGTDNLAGRYASSGLHVTISLEDDTPAEGVLDGNQLTVASDGDLLVFRRQ